MIIVRTLLIFCWAADKYWQVHDFIFRFRSPGRRVVTLPSYSNSGASEILKSKTA